MKILMITAEAMPFAKTGGLADVVSSLSKALADDGNDVKIIMPRYYGISRDILTLFDKSIQVYSEYTENNINVYTSVIETEKKNKVTFYFVDHEKSFGRDGIYGNKTELDYADNPKRFAILCQSAFQLCRTLNWYPDIMHSHDWSSALVPVLLKYNERKNPEFANTASILTIHNLGYQGIYGKHLFPSLGVDWLYYYSAGFDDWDNMNLLKAGIQCADLITTVSPNYSKQIQTEELGFRLNSLLSYRKDDLYGILNGIDTEIWNPMKDKLIPHNYSVNTLSGKEKNKLELQKQMGLEQNIDIPLIGMIARFTEQKGIFELFGPTYGSCKAICTDMRVQFVVLGAGEHWCEQEVQFLTESLPNFRCYIGYNENLSHLIEAGSDFFLMPSKYEPCGSNQMYSMLYGTLPIARNTGGLADTIENYNEKTGEGSGFLLNDLTPQSIYDTTGWAVFAWYNKKNHIQQMKKRVMLNDFTWSKSSKKYELVYQKALEKIFK